MPDESDSPSDIDVIKQRKKEGIIIPLTRNVQAKESSTYLEYVKFITLCQKLITMGLIVPKNF